MTAAPDVGARDRWVPIFADVARAWLADGRDLRLPLSGGCMRPTIPQGARIVVTPCDVTATRAGDVLVYEEASRLVCHRVLRHERGAHGSRLLTRGDGLREHATWIPAAAVIGRVIAIEHDGRRRALSGPRERLRASARVALSWLGVLATSTVRALRRASPVVRPA